MTDLYMTSLAVAGFRGVQRQIDLRFGKRLTVIYGGNATGKSSIAQAIEFAITGSVLDHELNAVPTHYLNHTTSSHEGRVTLRVSDGQSETALNAITSESRHQVEQRFRNIGSVDWPERQRLPVHTTHITPQGALARVLSADSVDRNDLSGLCTGAYLRFLLARANQLADHFRQAATGRNMMTALKDARAAYESARVLKESLGATRPESTTGIDPSKQVSEISALLGLSEVQDIGAILTEVAARADQAEQRLATIQRLLLRMRDLGQYEVELTQLRSVINQTATTETELLSKRDEITALLEAHRAQEIDAANRQDRATASVATYERYQQSTTLLDALEARLAQALGSLPNLNQQIESLASILATVTADQVQKSQLVVRAETGHATCRSQIETLTLALRRLQEMNDGALVTARQSLLENQSLLKRLREQESTTSSQVMAAQQTEAAARHELETQSHRNGRFLPAASELRAMIEDDGCTLCGHRHGTKEALESAIEAIVNARLALSRRQQEQYEQADSRLREATSSHRAIQEQVKVLEMKAAQLRQSLVTMEAQRAAAISEVQSTLTRQGLALSVTTESLESARDALNTRLSELAQDLEVARQAFSESSVARIDFERELAERSAEREQLIRLTNELREQIDAVREAQPAAASAEDANAARRELTELANLLTQLQIHAGKAAGQLAELDRQLTDARAQRAGAQRQLEALDGLLFALDTDLKKVGANREVAILLGLEASTRSQRDQMLSLRDRAVAAQRQLVEIERQRAYITAETQYRNALTSMDQLRRKQEQLNRRAAEFLNVQRELEAVQSNTAQAVLQSVRGPVGTMFRAMTAGCQWDIEFVLADGRVEAKLLDGMGNALAANAILNSAYLNVSAIALRIALASQQNWTSLRTVVLDDPILEMDSLTQSALLDGLESILSSPNDPWRNLQFVITTWSEDFAVLAAHKLAQLNTQAGDSEDFVIYRLASLPDGTVTPERHAPRWKAQADAA